MMKQAQNIPGHQTRARTEALRGRTVGETVFLVV